MSKFTGQIAHTRSAAPRATYRAAAIALAMAGLLPAIAAHAAEITVRATSAFRFEPNDVTINVGDTIKWVNAGGLHDVKADDDTFIGPQGQSWTFRRTFNSPGEVLYHCTVHSTPGQPITTAMNGRINVVGTPAVQINRGMSGAWFEPATSGQGMLIDVDPVTRFMFVAWFTYERPGSQAAPKIGSADNRWLTAQGNYSGNAAELSLFKTGGGTFDVGGGTTTTPSGRLTLEFINCNSAVATYVVTPDFFSSTIDLQRVLPGTQTACETAAAAESVEWD